MCAGCRFEPWGRPIRCSQRSAFFGEGRASSDGGLSGPSTVDGPIRETAMDRMTKESAVAELTDVFANTGSVVLANYSGMTVAEMTALRGKLREQGGTLKVVRNRLAKLALKGQKGEGASDMFQGTIVIAYSDDLSAAPKVTMEYAKANSKFEVIGGFMDEEILDAKGVEVLSKMPSREELIATVAARLLGQAGEIVSRITSPGQTLAGQIETIGEQAAS